MRLIGIGRGVMARGGFLRLGFGFPFCSHGGFSLKFRNGNVGTGLMFPGEGPQGDNHMPARKTKKTVKKKSPARLAKYRSMRDFAKTAEPSGDKAVGTAKTLRFVIQKHAATRLHYDFRLELNGTFRSWAVTRGPSLDPAQKRLAGGVEDHPLDYGDFKGTIPKGQYGGGTVMLWDRGFWKPQGDAGKMLAKGDLKFVLAGEKLKGGWVLVRMRERPGSKYGKSKHTNWLLIKH